MPILCSVPCGYAARAARSRAAAPACPGSAVRQSRRWAAAPGLPGCQETIGSRGEPPYVQNQDLFYPERTRASPRRSTNDRHRDHGKYPRLSRLRLNWLWIGLHLRRAVANRQSRHAPRQAATAYPQPLKCRTPMEVKHVRVGRQPGSFGIDFFASVSGGEPMKGRGIAAVLAAVTVAAGLAVGLGGVLAGG